MFDEVMRVGPKGQVVIPASLRQAMKIGPGSEIVFRLEKDKVIIDVPKIEDPVQTLESIAMKGKSVSKVDTHSYEDELDSRHS
ncbi:MAG TPA: AbrB/MazE/SpoVT family DNA-binding domain-containing protein [Candidatus Acidoferrales bacterium]|nr:AbrB/MazE/SpoVT family DNA-binding domain-containing protein [Candidatus Acidoferrales bacterium]